MKKTTIITALLIALMLLVSCGGGAGGNPADNGGNGNGGGNRSNLAGYSTLVKTVPSTEELEKGETFVEVPGTTVLEGLEGKWEVYSIEEHIAPAPKYAKKVTVRQEISKASAPGDNTHSYKTTYIYDYSAAMAELDESDWSTLKADVPEEGYTFDGYVATQTTGNYTSGVSTLDDVFGDFWYPESTKIKLNAATNSAATKIRVYNENSRVTTIYVKQQ